MAKKSAIGIDYSKEKNESGKHAWISAEYREKQGNNAPGYKQCANADCGVFVRGTQTGKCPKCETVFEKNGDSSTGKVRVSSEDVTKALRLAKELGGPADAIEALDAIPDEVFAILKQFRTVEKAKAVYEQADEKVQAARELLQEIDE